MSRPGSGRRGVAETGQSKHAPFEKARVIRRQEQLLFFLFHRPRVSYLFLKSSVVIFFIGVQTNRSAAYGIRASKVEHCIFGPHARSGNAVCTASHAPRMRRERGYGNCGPSPLPNTSGSSTGATRSSLQTRGLQTAQNAVM